MITNNQGHYSLVSWFKGLFPRKFLLIQLQGCKSHKLGKDAVSLLYPWILIGKGMWYLEGTYRHKLPKQMAQVIICFLYISYISFELLHHLIVLSFLFSHDGVHAPYYNADRQVAVNHVAKHYGVGVGTAFKVTMFPVVYPCFNLSYCLKL